MGQWCWVSRMNFWSLREGGSVLILKENLGVQSPGCMKIMFKKNMGLCCLQLQGLEHDEDLIESEF